MTRILIVEDEERICSFLQKGLRSNGYAASVARSGQEALTLCSTTNFDLILLDIGLPDVNGFEVLRRLRAQKRRAAVIMLTARDAVGDRVAGLEGGADDYLTKPFSFDELLAG